MAIDASITGTPLGAITGSVTNADDGTINGTIGYVAIGTLSSSVARCGITLLAWPALKAPTVMTDICSGATLRATMVCRPSTMADPATTEQQVAMIAAQFQDHSHMAREITLFAGRAPARIGGGEHAMLTALLDLRNFREIKPAPNLTNGA